MHTRRGALLAVTLLTGMSLPRPPSAAAVAWPVDSANAPRPAEPNDQRTPAGRVVDGELRIELDVVDITWSPRGPKGPSVPAAAFAERGHAPQMPGPLLRLQQGTPVRISVRNTLAKPVQLSGLADRARGDTAVKGRPAFMAHLPLVLAPGEEREVQFTPTIAVTSFYYGSVVPDLARPVPPGPQGGLVGAFVVDRAGAPPPPDERIFVITIGLGFKINGLSWPHTERLHYTEGEKVSWRVINISNETHPMHLHGFYFTLDTRGDAQADTVTALPRPLQVTEGLREFSTMRLSWTAERAGNWLFHCHLLVHSQGSGPDSTTAASADDMMMDGSMAGLILGITVSPRLARATAPPIGVRRLDLWTGTRPGVFGNSPGYGFVLQRGSLPPSSDSIIVPGSPLLLTRGQPTRIVVHNRLPIPLGLHWHGMELQSYYDGVGNWSGAPGNTRAPIPPGDSMSVYMTPPRAGTFMYHIHGEPGNELQQGLYGPLIVLERGHELNSDADRLFLLASRGAVPNAEAAVNGRGLPPAEQFDPGKTYRLRFMHISTNDVKQVRLLKDGAPVRWRPLARDGATLPGRLRAPVEATLQMDVGQTFDFEWTPAASGVHVLEVTTEFLLGPGPSAQRMAFGVGPVPEAELRIAATGTSLPVVDIMSTSLGKLAGAYVAADGSASAEVIGVWSVAGGLALVRTVAEVESPPSFLIPLADGTFVPGTIDNGLMKETLPVVPYHIDAATLSIGTGATARSFARVAALTLAEALLARLTGAYEQGIAIKLQDGGLIFSGGGGPPTGMAPVSPTRFLVDLGGATFVLEFAIKDGKAVSFTVLGLGFTVARRPD